jgi:3',5'-cyclic AMP phosphodiesterase CpdA
VQVIADRLPTAKTTSTREVTILHISDLHFDDPAGRGKEEKDNVHRYKQGPTSATSTLEADLVEDLAQRLKVIPDFIAASGDITYQSQRGGHSEAEKFFLRLRALLARKFAQEAPAYFKSLSRHEKERWQHHNLGKMPARLYDVARLLVVPGNHDIGWKPTSATTEEDSYRDFYFKIYGSNAHELLMHLCYDPDLDVALVGFNSAQLEPKHNGLGYVDPRQIREGRELVQARREQAGRPRYPNNTLRIAVIHHHLVQVNPIQYEEFKAGHFGVMINAEDFMRNLIRERFSLLLHGHQHQPFAALERRFFPGQGDQEISARTLAIIGAGSVGIAHKEVATGYGRNHYNLIVIHEAIAKIKWQCGRTALGGFDTESVFEVPITRP